jgi:hypothetical protein
MKLIGKHNRLVPLLAIPLLFAGCSPIFYAPNGHNVPIFSGKNEANITASGHIMGRSAGVNVQTAVACSDHIGIMANGFHVKTEYDDSEWWEEDSEEVSTGYLFELAPGYFTPLYSGSKIDLILETYGGMGFGRYENTSDNFGHDESPWPSRASYHRYFIQPSFGLKSAYFEVALSVRLAGLNYTNYKIDHDELPYLPLEKFTTLLEPGLTLRAGFKNFKFQAQLGFSINLNNEDLIQEYSYFSLGLYLNLSNPNNPGADSHTGTE